MICIDTRKHFCRITTVWLHTSDDPIPQGDVIEFIQAQQPLTAACREFESLRTDLTLDSEALLQKIDKDCRYEIRRAERDGVATEAFGLEGPVGTEKLRAYYDFYDRFAASKSLPVCDRFLVGRLAADGLLVLTQSTAEGEPLVYHAYIRDAKQVRLLHSVSLYRTDSPGGRALCSRANRMLHYRDMLLFREHGFESMDWGGISYDSPQIANITKFKKAFGGEPWTGYNFVLCPTWRGKLLRRMLSLAGKITRL